LEACAQGSLLMRGCGHGSDTLWLAAHGWQVTAVDFSAAALAHARSTAEAAGADVAGRVDWVEADLASWTPQPLAASASDELRAPSTWLVVAQCDG